MSNVYSSTLALDSTQESQPLTNATGGELKETAEIEKEIQHLNARLESLQPKLHQVNKTWKQKADQIQQSIQTCEYELQIKYHELHERKNFNHEKEEPDVLVTYPGPAYLAFADGNRFMVVATIVIFMNVAVIYMQLVQPERAADFFWANQFFMFFYILELILRARLFQNEFLCGPCARAWWNWFDLIIVLGGVFDMYLKPLLEYAHLMSASSSSGPSIFSVLRILRVARILKVVKVFMQADLSWCERDHFQAFIMGVIAFNCIIMGFEADYPDFFLWPFVEQGLLFIFFFELAVRLKTNGIAFFYSGDLVWNWIDFIIVIGGVVDGWLLPAIEIVKMMLGIPISRGGGLGQVVQMLRMVRMLRMLRLARLIRKIPPLYHLIAGIVAAMHGMLWVLVLTILVLYMVALLCVKLIRNGLAFPDGAPESAVPTFKDMPTAMFVAFMAMNGDVGYLQDFMEDVPVFRWWIMAFMIVSSWAILSILTAVVSDKMIEAGDTAEEEEHAHEVEEEEETMRGKLETAFDDINKRSHDGIYKSEFDLAMGDNVFVGKLCALTKMEENDIREIIDHVSTLPYEPGAEPIITKEAFVRGLTSESRSVNERGMLRLEKRMSILDFQNKQILAALRNLQAAGINGGSTVASSVNRLSTDDGRQWPVLTTPPEKQVSKKVPTYAYGREQF